LVLPLILLVSAICLPALAQTTYVITDGDQVKVYTTFATDPASVLDKAGYALDPEDEYTTLTNDGVSEITVRRNQVITVDNCGELIEVNTFGETVGELLERLDIPTNGCFQVSHSLQMPTSDGLQLQVICQTEREEVRVENVPYQTRYCQSAGLAVGQEEVIVAGADGQKRIVELVSYTNYEEQTRTLVEESVLREPVDRIVVVGTGTEGKLNKKAPAIGDGVIVLPTGEILTYSSTGKYKSTAYTHTDAGCDMITATGSVVRVGTVAVDPKVIPYGTRMYIVSNDGKYIYGLSAAEDCGGGIKGNRLDLYFPTTSECFKFGVRGCTVYFLD
jgi:3D (Asp-Asp-Asp) domain-containing protein